MNPVSVVIPHRRSRDEFFYRYCLPSIKAQGPAQIILIPNNGESGTPSTYRNQGLRQANEEYVLFCDDDIILGFDFLEKMLATLHRDRSADFAYCDFAEITMLPGVDGGTAQVNRLEPFNPVTMRKYNQVPMMSLIYRKACPGFDESLKRLVDWDMWLTMIERGSRGAHIPEVLFHQYFIDIGVTATGSYEEAMKLVLAKHKKK